MSTFSVGTRPVVYDANGFELSNDGVPLVKFQRMDPEAILPTRATDGAACWDLYSNELTHLGPARARVTVGTGVKIELPQGYVGLVCSRSGLAANQGIFVLNAPGVIDPDYRGEIKVILALHLANHLYINVGDPYVIGKGSRIAQLMILPLAQIGSKETSDFTSTARGEGGFGSTGVGALEPWQIQREYCS